MGKKKMMQRMNREHTNFRELVLLSVEQNKKIELQRGAVNIRDVFARSWKSECSVQTGIVRCAFANHLRNCAALTLILAAPVLPAQPEQSRFIPGEYIVSLKSGNNPAEVASAHGLKRRQTYSHALTGFAASIPDGRLHALQNDPRVELIEA